MKLLNVLPVAGNQVLSQEALDYMTKNLLPDTKVDNVCLSKGMPSIESEYDECVNSPESVALCIKAEKDGYDGCFINCFGDPGVRAARECVDIPIFGGFEPAIHIALGLGDKIGIVTVLNNVLAMLRGNAAKAHLSERIVCIRSINIPVLDLGAHDKLVNAMITESIKAIEEDGAEVIVGGCTGMVGVTEAIKEGLLANGYDVPVIEAGQSAFMMLELYARMGLKQSRITYMKPPKGV